MGKKRSVHEVAFRLSYDMSLQIAPRLDKVGADLAPQQLRTMRLIWSGDNITLVDIAKMLKRDKAQVVRLVDSLETAGMVVRKPNPADGRSKILKLTPKGNGLFSKIEKIESQFSKQLISGISSSDLQTFFEVSDKLSENLKEIDVP